MWMLSTMQASTWLPLWCRDPSRASFMSSFDGGPMSLNPYAKGVTVEPETSRTKYHTAVSLLTSEEQMLIIYATPGFSCVLF